MKPQPGQVVDYHAYAGDVYQAVVLGVRDHPQHTLVDLDVMSPGCSDRLTLTKIIWNDGLFPFAGGWL